VDIDGALDEGAEGLRPALVERLDLAPVFGEAGDQFGDALGIDFAGIEFEVPVPGADGLVEPQRILLALEELAEQLHRVPVDEHAA
jgi:hypothetical protein